MKLEKLHCPDCDGEIKYIGDGRGYCEKCSTVYELLDDEDEAAEAASAKEADGAESEVAPFDIVEFIEYAGEEARKLDLTDIKIGKEACEFGISKKALDKIKEKCRVPRGETPLIILDSSVLGTGSVGFVITEKGFYGHEYFETKHYNWERFKEADIFLDAEGFIAVDDTSFVCLREQAEVIMKLLQLLQSKLKEQDKSNAISGNK